MSSAKPGKPTWRRAFDSVERKVGEPLEDAAGSETYVGVVLRGLRIQRAVGGAVGRVAGGAVGRVLRVANIPTRSDIRKLSRQVTVLTGEVRELKTAQTESERTRQLAAKNAPAKTPAARRAPAKRPAAKRAPAKDKGAGDSA